MKTVSSKNCLRKFLFLAATAFLLVAGLTVEGLAQSRGGARPVGGGGVRPSTPVMRPGRDIVVVPAGRRGPAIDEFPGRVRRVPEIDRRDDINRRERERRDVERPEVERRDEETRRDVSRRQEDEANRFQKLGRWLGVDPERLQNYYQQAKANNPDLRLGQFFGALVIANRLNGSSPNVTAQAILRGLDAGMNMERTLVALGLTAEEAKSAAKWAERVVNHLKP